MKSNQEVESPGEASMRSLLGDMDGLTGQIGLSGSELVQSGGESGVLLETVNDEASLESFLESYCRQQLYPIELPAVVESANYVANGQFRELMALDQRLAEHAEQRLFSEQSRWIGLCHSRSMRGMKDHRTVWRYCEAIRTKEAFGWHVVVYGVVLGAFSIPLRQGLVNYSQQIVGGFIESAQRRFAIEPVRKKQIRERTLSGLGAEIDRVVVGEFPKILGVL